MFFEIANAKLFIMKTLKVIPIVTVTSIFFASCGDSKDKAESQPSTVVIENNDSKPAKDDEGSNLNFNISSDEDGNVSGGVSGEVSSD